MGFGVWGLALLHETPHLVCVCARAAIESEVLHTRLGPRIREEWHREREMPPKHGRRKSVRDSRRRAV